MGNHDFEKYLIKDRKINSLYINDYFKHQNNTNHIIDDGNVGIFNIFSKLIENRIIFLSTEMGSEVCNLIKAQLLYLEQISDEDIKRENR